MTQAERVADADPLSWEEEAWCHRIMTASPPARWDEYAVALELCFREIFRLRAKLRSRR